MLAPWLAPIHTYKQCIVRIFSYYIAEGRQLYNTEKKPRDNCNALKKFTLPKEGKVVSLECREPAFGNPGDRGDGERGDASERGGGGHLREGCEQTRSSEKCVRHGSGGKMDIKCYYTDMRHKLR